MLENIVMAFVVGGLICVLGQLLMDLTNAKVQPAHILVGFVTGGVILGGLGLYEPLVQIGGAGATVPLSGFGYTLVKGAIKGAESQGLLGAFAGGVEAAAVGIAVAVFFGYLVAVTFNPKG
ncbi:MAG: stage V sporulation protein AE [Desulfitobacteriia bacterium]